MHGKYQPPNAIKKYRSAGLDKLKLASMLIPPDKIHSSQTAKKEALTVPIADAKASASVIEKPDTLLPAPVKPALWQHIKSFLASFNPKKVFWDRPKEDITAFRKARMIRDADIAAHPEIVRAKVDIKFLGAIALSEFAGTCIGAPALGVTFQEATGNAYLGILGTVIGDYLPAVLTFQAAWLALNLDFYKHRSKSILGRVKEFYKDVIPIHYAAALASIPAYAAGSAISSALIFGVNAFFQGMAERMKIMPLVSEIINFGIVESIYLYLLGAGTTSSINKITEMFTDYLKTRFGAPQPMKSASETN